MVALPCPECHYVYGHTATCSEYHKALEALRTRYSGDPCSGDVSPNDPETAEPIAYFTPTIWTLLVLDPSCKDAPFAGCDMFPTKQAALDFFRVGWVEEYEDCGMQPDEYKHELDAMVKTLHDTCRYQCDPEELQHLLFERPLDAKAEQRARAVADETEEMLREA